MQNDNILTIENAHIIFRNFQGEATKYNRQGARNFCVIIEDEHLVEDLRIEGWNVKTLRKRDEGDEDQYYIKVNVNFGSPRPPKVTLISGKVRTELTEETIGSLDYADITNVDLTVTPYHYELSNGDKGVSGYLKTMWVTIDQDPFASKYAEEEFPGEVPF